MDVSQWRILVVDDEEDNVGVVQLVMEFNDIPLSMANSAKHCLEILESETPTLLLLDIRMPEVNGFELLSMLRSDQRWQNLPSVAMTAQAMQGDRERILAAGFDGYISKPIGPMTLMKDLIAVVKGRDTQ